MILICKEQTDAFSKISDAAFAELPAAIREIEVNTKKLFQNDKINYLMLMMVDPEVHFHVIPRYANDKEFEGITFKDSEWPKKADIDVVNDIAADDLQRLAVMMRESFNR